MFIQFQVLTTAETFRSKAQHEAIAAAAGVSQSNEVTAQIRFRFNRFLLTIESGAHHGIEDTIHHRLVLQRSAVQIPLPAN